MLLSDLRDKKVATLDGETLGRVHEVHCQKGRIVALMCGPNSLLERLTGRSSNGRRILWERVRKVEAKRILVTPDPPQRNSSSASRSRQGTRRPSGPRPKR